MSADALILLYNSLKETSLAKTEFSLISFIDMVEDVLHIKKIIIKIKLIRRQLPYTVRISITIPFNIELFRFRGLQKMVKEMIELLIGEDALIMAKLTWRKMILRASDTETVQLEKFWVFKTKYWRSKEWNIRWGYRRMKRQFVWVNCGIEKIREDFKSKSTWNVWRIVRP